MTPDKIQTILDIVTIVTTAFIILFAIGSRIYIGKQNKKHQLTSKRRWIELLPSITSTLGVLGTFIGITVGLCFFNTKNLNESIPLLLSGLKTAFFTSLAGMISSMFLSRYVSKLFDNEEHGVNDINGAASLIANSIQKMQTQNTKMLNKLDNTFNLLIINQKSSSKYVDDRLNSIGVLLDNTNAYLKDISHVKDNLNNIEERLSRQATSFTTILNVLTNVSTSIADIASKVFEISKFDKDFKQMEDTLKAQLSDISNAKDTIARIVYSVGEMEETTKSLNVAMKDVKADIKSCSSNIGEIKKFKSDFTSIENSLQKQISDLSSVKGAMASIVSSVGNIEDDTKGINASSKAVKENTDSMDTNIGEIATATEASSGTEESILEETKKFSQFISDEVDDIERKMGETNTLLTKKFDEFSDLLKKSNTEALVEVMKRLTEDFQKQMGSLIQKLVQENFDQLNKSVERLNTWQKENKEQIAALITQYKDMEHDFENSSTTLTKVSSETKALVGDGGKLQQLITSLNKIILEDKAYVEITKSLMETAKITENNMVKFDNSTNKLNEWIRKQRNFSESVNVLIAKLDELNKIRNYGEQFWKDTKKGMEEGVGIIKSGSTELGKQIRTLDQSFYQRLSATLASLDACIQAMVEATKRKN